MNRLSREHEEIYDAIARQDSDAARAAMRLHLTNSRESACVRPMKRQQTQG
jgi:GntR family transcriptional repressor for pyruvate dehydrogenase complex